MDKQETSQRSVQRRGIPSCKLQDDHAILSGDRPAECYENSLITVVPGKFQGLKLYAARVLKETRGVGLHGIQGQDLVWITSHNVCNYCVGGLATRVVVGDDHCVSL